MEATAYSEMHQSVLLEETVQMLRVQPGKLYVDGTFGLGGHTSRILKDSAPDGRVIAFEWDERAIELGSTRIAEERERVTIIRKNFAELDAGLAEAGIEVVDGIMADIGMSSLQIDHGQRGFSFKKDEPLDMRMDQRRALTAATLVDSASADELADIFYCYGDERQSRRIANCIVEERRRKRIETTAQLADIVAQAIPKRFHPPKIHVATKVFQALRIAVNDELANLASLLDKAADYLVAGGRLCIISFHSIEDRMVKRKLAASAMLKPITKKPIMPEQSEIIRNPRARSARLRVAERLA
ncbi:MAG: 16S rRNA (cytosine(1402)-N(4))-methyltransferase RsmH [Desulfobulbaceae bacterium]|nr:MAG: 16S rRNA (cytosine(1402)-N(4))-methyltransferase RsmH [Desulfobulbaceae bacterium]